MARPIRVEYPNAVYHVTARGNERRAIFLDDRDRQRFLETLAEARERFSLLVHAFCLMPNHYHLLLQTPHANLSVAAGWLQTRIFGQVVPSPWVDLRQGLVLGGEALFEKVRHLLAEGEGQEEIRWRRRAEAEEVSRAIRSLVEREPDRRVAIWLRAGRGGERMTKVAEEYGYRDGSGVHQVVKRLEERAKNDRALSAHLARLAQAASSVKS